MTNLNQSDVFLVGSVPLEPVSEVFELCARTVGDRVFAMPDGEPGARQWWIVGLERTTYSQHPDLELDPDNSGPPHVYGEFINLYRRKAGVTDFSLKGHLPYAADAIKSYGDFRRLKEAGTIPEDVRFQVAMPTPNAATLMYFADVERDWADMQAAYAEAAINEIDVMLEEIPADDLVIQWDYATELGDIISASTGEPSGGHEVAPWVPVGNLEETLDRWTSADYVRPITEAIPSDVMIGWHLCLGTWPRQPMATPHDLAPVVEAANRLVANTPRRVDFMHIPTTREADEAFFAPLADLDVGDARVFLGIEGGDGAEELHRRVLAARKALPSFGISHYCGYGRDSADRMPELLGLLRDESERLAASSD